MAETLDHIGIQVHVGEVCPERSIACLFQVLWRHPLSLPSWDKGIEGLVGIPFHVIHTSGVEIGNADEAYVVRMFKVIQTSTAFRATIGKATTGM